jgi:hypothetical protein
VPGPDLPDDFARRPSRSPATLLEAEVLGATSVGKLEVVCQALDGGTNTISPRGYWPAAKAGDVVWLQRARPGSDDWVAVAWEPVGNLPSWPTSEPL